MVCTLFALVTTAIAHHALFYPLQCMLNPFGPEYDLETVSLWLTRDPSLLFAVLTALLVFRVGERRAALRCAVAAFVVAFAPLALWIWDVPLTGRSICLGMHDGRAVLVEGMPLQSRHFYLLGAVLQPLILILSLRLRGLRLVAPSARARLLRVLATSVAFRSQR